MPATIEDIYANEDAAVLADQILSGATIPGNSELSPYIELSGSIDRQSRIAEVRIGREGGAVKLVIEARRPLEANLVKAIRKVADTLSLEAGWNSHRARPIESASAKRAILLLGQIMQPEIPVPAVVPRVQGGLQLEWSVNGIDLEIYIDGPDRIRFFAEDLGSGEEAEAVVDAEGLVILAAWLWRLSA